MVSCKSPYEPREDSTLLEHYVRQYAKGNVLDMGTGSGIQTIAAAHSSKVDSIVAADILKSAVDYCKKCIKHRKIKKFLVSDLFDGIKNDNKLKNAKFDTIIFNPPYLPDELKIKDLTLEGGKKGYEVIERFINEANDFLNPDGVILIVFSSLTKKDKVEEFIRNNLLKFEMLEKQHYFFEDLYIYLIEKTGILEELDRHAIKDLSYFAKGKRGLVFTARYKGRKIAVKTNNPKSEAALRMENEAKFLKLLNKKNIGPKLLLHGNNFLAYEFAEGHNIMEFLDNFKNEYNQKSNKQKNNKTKTKKIVIKLIKEIMAQLYLMDKLRINKQEMSHPQKHILIGKNNNPALSKIVPILIDFERCRYTLNPGNVTQFCDFLISDNILGVFKNNKIDIDKEKIIEAARKYKKERSKDNFSKILSMIK